MENKNIESISLTPTTLLTENCIINSSNIIKEISKKNNIKSQLHLVVILNTIKSNLENIKSNINTELKNKINIELKNLNNQLKIIDKAIKESQNKIKWFVFHQQWEEKINTAEDNIISILDQINKKINHG